MRLLIAGDRREWCEGILADMAAQNPGAFEHIQLAWPGEPPHGKHDLVPIQYDSRDPRGARHIARAATARRAPAGIVIYV